MIKRVKSHKAGFVKDSNISDQTGGHSCPEERTNDSTAAVEMMVPQGESIRNSNEQDYRVSRMSLDTKVEESRHPFIR